MKTKTSIFAMLLLSLALVPLPPLLGDYEDESDDYLRTVPQATSALSQSDPDWDESSGVRRTEQDWAGSYNRYYGQRRDQYKDKQRRIAKVAIDGDFNYTGTIEPGDPGAHGAFKRTPPGLVVGVGEMSKLLLRIVPYRVDWTGDAVIALEVVGINRSDPSGLFDSLEQEVANTSRVRVWRDAARTELLLDSADPNLRRVEWEMDNTRTAMGGAITGMNLPFQSYPRAVYVEGISPHGPYLGDIRLLITCEHRDAEEDGRPSFGRFRSAWNHMLMTVTPEPMAKEFVVSEALQDIWIRPGQQVGVTSNK